MSTLESTLVTAAGSPSESAAGVGASLYEQNLLESSGLAKAQAELDASRTKLNRVMLARLRERMALHREVLYDTWKPSMEPPYRTYSQCFPVISERAALTNFWVDGALFKATLEYEGNLLGRDCWTLSFPAKYMADGGEEAMRAEAAGGASANLTPEGSLGPSLGRLQDVDLPLAEAQLSPAAGNRLAPPEPTPRMMVAVMGKTRLTGDQLRAIYSLFHSGMEPLEA